MDNIAMQLEVDTWLYIKPTGQVAKLVIPDNVKNNPKSFFNSKEGIEIRRNHHKLLQDFYAGKKHSDKYIYNIIYG